MKIEGTDKGQTLKPKFCSFGIIDDCILRCKMCDKWKKDKHTSGKPKPTLEEWKRAASQIRDLVDENFEIYIGGGEPLLMNWLWDFVRYCADIGFKVTVASNGYLIDKKTAQEIARSGLFSLILSLDSLDEEIHDRWRGVRGAHKKVMEAIDNLAEYYPGLHIGIATIIMEDNLDGVIELLEWVENISPRVRSINFQVPMQPNNTYCGKDELNKHWYNSKEFSQYWPQDTKKAVSVIDEIIKHSQIEQKLVGNQPIQLEAFERYLSAPDRFVKSGPCNLEQAIHISSVGDIFLCYNWKSLGNIKEQKDDIRTLWLSEKAGAIRENIRGCKENCHFLINCFFEESYPFIMN